MFLTLDSKSVKQTHIQGLPIVIKCMFTQLDLFIALSIQLYLHETLHFYFSVDIMDIIWIIENYDKFRNMSFLFRNY